MSALAATLLLALTAGVQGPSDGCPERIAGFLETLAAFRAGDDALAAELTEAGEQLCAECKRCDARAIAAYYVALPREARLAGLEEERRFSELFESVQQAGRAGVSGPAWALERERLLGALRALADRARGAPDITPGARALALAARLQVERLQVDPDLDPASRADLARQAEDHLREALELFELAGQRTPQLEPLWLTARLDLFHGRFDAARRGFDAVAALAAGVGNRDYQEYALRGQVSLARAAGDLRAMDRLLVKLAGLRDPRESWPLARDWAERLLAEDHVEEALDFLERMEPGAQAHVLDRLEWDLSIGGALLRLEEVEEAREHLERAASGAPSEPAVLALAQLALEEGRGFEVRSLLGDRERLAGFSARGRADAGRILGEERLRAGDAEGAVVELEAALELSERWRGALLPEIDGNGGGRFDPGALESVLGEWSGLHTLALLADAHARSGRPLEALRQIAQGHSPSLREARSGAAGLRELASGGDPASISLKDLEAWVRHGELGLVAWVIGPDFGLAVHAWGEADRPRAVAARLACGRTAVADAARRLREAAISGDPAWIEREAAGARAALFPEPIRASLLARASGRGSDARLLLLVHGPLERLPFELLSLEDGGLTLDEMFTLSALPGLPDATPPAPLAPFDPASWTLLGAPVDCAGFPELPGAESELKELARLHRGARLFAGRGFTADELVRALGEGRALHLATHLVAQGSAGAEAALLASGGEQVSARSVRALARPLPLVVLSGCETGGGAFVDAQGLHGVARAFLETGTRALVVTLWPVADGPAQQFGVAFHRALLTGAIPSAAARAARGALRAAGHGAAEWAAFRAVGAD